MVWNAGTLERYWFSVLFCFLSETKTRQRRKCQVPVLPSNGLSCWAMISLTFSPFMVISANKKKLKLCTTSKERCQSLTFARRRSPNDSFTHHSSQYQQCCESEWDQPRTRLLALSLLAKGAAHCQHQRCNELWYWGSVELLPCQDNLTVNRRFQCANSCNMLLCFPIFWSTEARVRFCVCPEIVCQSPLHACTAFSVRLESVQFTHEEILQQFRSELVFFLIWDVPLQLQVLDISRLTPILDQNGQSLKRL